jgi:AraC-like DNA-binding protein
VAPTSWTIAPFVGQRCLIGTGLLDSRRVEPLLAASITRTLIATAERLGVDADRLLRDVGVDPEAVQASGARIPVRQHMDLFRLAVARSGRADFALEVGRSFRPGTLHVLSYAAMNASDLGAAWQCFARYWQLVAEGTRLSITIADSVASLSFEMTDPRLPFAREGSESICAGQLTFARWLTQQPLRPLAVHFVFDEPPHAAAHRALFECPVHFGAERTRLEWDPAVLAIPILASDPALAKLFEAQLCAPPTGSTPSVSERVRALLARHLDSGDLQLDDIASQLALSRRSLQRRLSEEGTTFQRLVDEVRHQRCIQLLEDHGLPLEELAFLLGFSEPSAFFRAFRRWTGASPGEWRSSRRLPDATGKKSPSSRPS